MADHHVELVTMNDQVAFAVGSFVNDAVGHFDAAEMRTEEAAQKLVVISRNIDDPGSLAPLAQDLLHHVVVKLWPVPGPPQTPAIGNVADQVDGLGFIVLQKVQQHLRLTTARAKMDVGNKQGPVMPRCLSGRHSTSPNSLWSAIDAIQVSLL